MGKMKVGIIERGRKTDWKEAANCLLKTLEEPPGESMVILITSQRASLFTIIFSLSSDWSFLLFLLQKSVIVGGEEGMEGRRGQESIFLFQGSLGKARSGGVDGMEDRILNCGYKLKSRGFSFSGLLVL